MTRTQGLWAGFAGVLTFFIVALCRNAFDLPIWASLLIAVVVATMLTTVLQRVFTKTPPNGNDQPKS